MALMDNPPKNPQVSIIIPTYNESKNILDLLKSIREHIPKNLNAEAIVVDDNSPDGTGKLVEEHIKNVKKFAHYTVNVIHRRTKKGLSSAILNGIQKARGSMIVVLDSDFSHPPQIIPKLIDALKHSQYDIAVASRYVKGGAIKNWSIKRKLISKIATKIAQKGLGINTYDPMSGFFAFKKSIIQDLKFDAIGYKMLLEILVKTKNAKVKEIPYTFTDREFGSSKLSISVMIDFFYSVWRLYRYGAKTKKERRTSVRFISKAARFYTVGASGLGVNYLVSMILAMGFTDVWYLYANAFGIFASMSSNFVLNKFWTFEDRDKDLKRTMTQYLKFLGISSFGALIQLGMVFTLIENNGVSYPIALVVAVLTAAFGNFILNKKLTFKEKLWS